MILQNFYLHVPKYVSKSVWHLTNPKKFSETAESYKFLSPKHWTKTRMRNGFDGSPMMDQRYANYYIQNGDASSNEHISFLAGVRIIREDRHPDKYSGKKVVFFYHI